MSRVLLLADEGLDFQSRRANQSLFRDLGSGHAIRSHAVGIGGESISRNLRLLRDIRTNPADVIHATGLTALSLAAVAHSGPIVFSFVRFPTRPNVRWLNAVMSYRDVQVICPTSTMRKFCVTRGVPIERCHLIRPGVEFGRINRRRDAKFRLSLGFAESDYVFLLPGESTAAAGHASAVWTNSILNELDPKYKILAWGRGDKVDQLHRFSGRQHHGNQLAIAERRLGRPIEFEELLPAADAVLITATGPVSTLPIAVCMAAGLPIVSTVTHEVAELLEDRHTALMAPKSSPRAISQRIMDLQADKDVQWAISDMAKTEAFEYFAHSRFMNQYRVVFRQVLAGEKISVPEASPGAGARFHGLG